MPSMELQSSPATFASFTRSLLNVHRDLDDSQPEQGIDAFQLHVAVLFAELSSAAAGDNFFSLLWIRKLLDAFLFCQEEFRFILSNNRHLLSRPPMDRLISDFNDRSVKALDLCNAIRDGIEQVRQWEKHMEIVLIALDPRQNLISQGQIRRAEKALIDLSLFIHDQKESSSVLAQRSRHFRSSSWSVSRSWSAAKQDRGLQANFSITKPFPWGASVISLHERIMEESKKRERKKSVGLLKEIHQLEKCTRRLLQLTQSVDQFPERKEAEMIRQAVFGLGDVYNSMSEDLELLGRQVRGVFHEIVSCRIEGLNYLHKQE